MGMHFGNSSRLRVELGPEARAEVMTSLSLELGTGNVKYSCKSNSVISGRASGYWLLAKGLFF